MRTERSFEEGLVELRPALQEEGLRPPRRAGPLRAPCARAVRPRYAPWAGPRQAPPLRCLKTGFPTPGGSQLLEAV